MNLWGYGSEFLDNWTFVVADCDPQFALRVAALPEQR